jgi:hypothetical protein
VRRGRCRRFCRGWRRARDEGFSHVILDGKIIPCDRCKEPAVSVKGQVIDLWYSGKAAGWPGGISPPGLPQNGT